MWPPSVLQGVQRDNRAMRVLFLVDSECACWSVEAAEATVLAAARAALHVASYGVKGVGGTSPLRVAYHVFDSVGGVERVQSVGVSQGGGRRGFHELDRGALGDLRDALVGAAARREAARRGAAGSGEVTPRDGHGGRQVADPPPRSPAARLWQNPTLLALNAALNDFDWASIDLEDREEDGDDGGGSEGEDVFGGGDDSPVGVVPQVSVGGGSEGREGRGASRVPRGAAAVVVVGGLDASCRGVAYDCGGARGGGTAESHVANVTGTLESLGESYGGKGVALKWIDMGTLGGPGQSPGQRVALANAVKNVLLGSCMERMDGGLIAARWLPLPASAVLPPAENFFRMDRASGGPGMRHAATVSCALALPGGASLSLPLVPALSTDEVHCDLTIEVFKMRTQDASRTLCVPRAMASHNAADVYYVRHTGLLGWLRLRGVSLEGLADARRECVLAALSPDVGVLIVAAGLAADCPAEEGGALHADAGFDARLRPAALHEATLHMEELGVHCAAGVDADGAAWASLPEAAFADPWFLSYARPCKRKARSDGSFAGVLAQQCVGRGGSETRAPQSSSLDGGSLDTEGPSGDADVAAQDAAYAEYLQWKRSLVGGGEGRQTVIAADQSAVPPSAEAATTDAPMMDPLAVSEALRCTYESVVKADRDDNAVILPDLDISVDLIHKHVGQSLRFLAQSFGDAARALPAGARDALAVSAISPSDLKASFRQSYMNPDRVREKMITYQVQVCLRLEALRWDVQHSNGSLKTQWARAASEEISTLMDGVSLMSPSGVQSLVDDVLAPRYCETLPPLVRKIYQDLELQPSKNLAFASLLSLDSGSAESLSAEDDDMEEVGGAISWDYDGNRELALGRVEEGSAGLLSQPLSSQPRTAMTRQASGGSQPLSSSQEEAAPASGSSREGSNKGGGTKAWYRAPSKANLLRNRSVGLTVTLQKGAKREKLNTTAARIKGADSLRGGVSSRKKQQPSASTSARRPRPPASDGSERPASHGPKGSSKKTRRSLALDLPAVPDLGTLPPAPPVPPAMPQHQRAPGAAAALLQSGGSAPTGGAFGTMARLGRVASGPAPQAAPQGSTAGATAGGPVRISAPPPPAFTSNALRGLSFGGGKNKVLAPPPSVVRPKALNRLLSRSLAPLAKPKGAMVSKPSTSTAPEKKAADAAGASSEAKKPVARRLI